MRDKIIFILVILFSLSSFPQQVTNWKNYTDMKRVSDVNFSNNIIWAATDGGAFKFSLQDNSFSVLSKADGLQGISLSSNTLDNLENVWFGSTNGVIDIYNPDNQSFGVILDIANSNQVNKRINDLSTISDTIIVSSDFGVSLIDVNSFLFYDTFFKFGEFTTNTRVNYAFKFNLFYVCTDEGIAIQKPGATNLSAPESWNTYNSSDGLPSDKALKIVKYLDVFVAATDKGLASFDGTQWLPFIPQFNNKVVSDIISAGDSLIILSENTIYIYQNGSALQLYSSAHSLNRLSLNQQFGIAGASNNGILILNSENSPEFLIPNGPAANQFPSISVDGNGVFWSASGKDETGVGFYTFDKETWANYNVENTPQLPNNDIYTVFNSSDNTAYLATWGYGFVRTDGNSFETFNSANSGMQGIPENPNFLVITGFGIDTRNNLWVLNLRAADRKPLSMLSPDSVWYHFQIPAEQNRLLFTHFNLDIDPYDTKWYNSDDASKSGLFYFNEMKTYDDPGDDRSGFITSADGLNSNDIRSIVVDRRGDVWIGTGLGVNVISQTNTITSAPTNDPSLRMSSIFTLRQQSINDIAVDPLNQKWVATNQGLLFVNSDGSRLLAAYDSKNSPILSDIITSVAIDENAGIVYVGTDKGLTSFETPFTKPKEAFDELFIYPNPYVVTDGSILLTIDGLVRESDIKILTIDGKLVAEFPSPGGRTAFWDGRDDNGNLISSGVYLVVAIDSGGNNTITGKVAVFRK
ncbi:MAG: two-component regulator propeller domain-containing protein [Ignavibacteriaceae bacterium]